MTGPKSTLVSIIMPAYNAAATIDASIDSVQKQTYTDWEVIVVNDGSTDATKDIVTGMAATDPRIRLLQLPKNGGLANARNQGILAANGELIAFLDSDDLWLPEKISRQVEFHNSHPDISISHTGFEMFNQNGVVRRRFSFLVDPVSRKSGNVYPSICYKNPIGVLTVVAKRDMVVKTGMFDTSLWTFEDQDLWIRIARQGARFGYLSQTLASYRLSPTGITSKTGKYKTAYKKFIKKVLTDNTLDTDLLWRQYYRYFGTVYFKRGGFQLSRMYFSKSIRLKPFDTIAITTILYLVMSFAKEMFGKRVAV